MRSGNCFLEEARTYHCCVTVLRTYPTTTHRFFLHVLEFQAGRSSPRHNLGSSSSCRNSSRCQHAYLFSSSEKHFPYSTSLAASMSFWKQKEELNCVDLEDYPQLKILPFFKTLQNYKTKHNRTSQRVITPYPIHWPISLRKIILREIELFAQIYINSHWQ